MKAKTKSKIKSKWILFISLRYIFRRKSKSPSPVFSMLGIATGVMALIVIIAVMNGFQLSFIESIIELSSYHLRAEPVKTEQIDTARNEILKIPGVETVIPFHEFQALVRGRRGGQQAVLIKGLLTEALSQDEALAERLNFTDGSFDIIENNSILLGSELSRRMVAGVGSEVNVFSIFSIFSDEEEGAGSQYFTVTGVFETGYYEYDNSWAIINMQSASFFSELDPVLGIKISNHFNDQRMLENVRDSLLQIPEFEEIKFSSWRDYNRSFFGALRTEKLFMFILVGLIFIVVGLNIFQSQRRSVLEHREEIGLIRAIGGSEMSSRLIFTFGGAFIGFIGAFTGVCLGLLLANNISIVFTVIESVANFFISIINFFASFFNAADVEDFSIFSPAIFYIKEIPSRIIKGEVLLIFSFGFLSALLAAWFASRRISKIRPAEVLRYE